MLSVEDSVKHLTLSRHPKNRSLVDIKNKRTNELCYIKIRHRLANFYALSVVDPTTFEVQAETQVKGASARVKPITLQGYKEAVLLKDSSMFGMEWSFEWEKQRFKWVRESLMRPGMECRAVYGKGNDVCIAQYLPRGVKNEYFGLLSLLEYNMDRCNVQDDHGLELVLVTTLMTILDKADDTRWRKEVQHGGAFLEINEVPGMHPPTEETTDKKQQQRKEKNERDIEQRLQWMLEKDVRRSQKQLRKQTVVHSQQTSPSGSPLATPLGSPTASTHDLSRLSQHHQQLEYLSHMLSTMKHSADATATLPSSFVQPSAQPTLKSLWDDHQLVYHDEGPFSARPPSNRRLSSTDFVTGNNRYSVPVPPRSHCFPQR
ncbi:hypothetical protein DM01DRAFT_1379463 [Hesseltinella vesiculosa]|uniref:Uncharacterized protein n=1 Tax=Hesseltinella vesiculosa TaxID=101127 RepID=A0A1X2GXW5_9FUNG|nr:hypothetical protein DM01DRAFT_1379463 [Hesseltinella vesiculosa]